MLKNKIAATSLAGAITLFSAYWVSESFNSALEESSISLPQRTIKAVTIAEPAPVINGAEAAWAGQQYQELEKAVSKVWGVNEVVLPEPSKYVKYTQGYEARAAVNFENGALNVETVDSRNPQRSLRDAIITTALAPASPKVDQFSARDVPLNGEPALYGQVLNQKGQSIRHAARAGEYADELIRTSMQKREIKVNGVYKTVYSVNASLASDSLKQRAAKYEKLIKNSAARYGLGERLLYAIAHTESYFNPFAVSSASAYGLMQIVPSSAGAEVYEHITGKKGRPSREYLFNPANNIEYGAAYLHLLARRYFNNIKNPASRELCTIAAYNGGPNAVLKSFAPNSQAAIKKINSMSSKEVYRHLVFKLPSSETRRYVDKVLASLGTFTAKQ